MGQISLNNVRSRITPSSGLLRCSENFLALKPFGGILYPLVLK